MNPVCRPLPFDQSVWSICNLAVRSALRSTSEFCTQAWEHGQHARSHPIRSNPSTGGFLGLIL